MTDKEIFEKLEAEIERLENYENESVTSSDIRFGWIHGKTFALTSIRVLLDSMQKEPISDDLEQAIDTYLATYFGGEKEKQDWPYLKKMAIHFANWQKDQLMAKAIDGEVGYWNLRGLSINTDLLRSVSEGDKVKIIVIKED